MQEDMPDREKTSMKEAIELANKKYGAPPTELIRKKKKDPER